MLTKKTELGLRDPQWRNWVSSLNLYFLFSNCFRESKDIYFISFFSGSLNPESQEWAKKSEIEPQPATEVKNGETTTTKTTVEEKPAEEEARELTLDEWKALRSNRQKPQYNLRKVKAKTCRVETKKM